MPPEDQDTTARTDVNPRIEDRLLESRTILVGEEVTDALYRKVASALLVLEQKDPKGPITVLVNSPGGSADSGFAMYDLLRFTCCPVRTIANGLVASAAVLVFLAAPKGSRLSLPSSRFLLHQPSTITRGQSTDIDIAARQIIELRKRYNTIVSDTTGKSLEVVERDSERDFWLTAPTAQEYGLVDRIVTRRAELD
ncbi:MAG: ATP-dependent Clp protease proteolytic subunit [Myxococcota bacterium]|nr:ATP-dependent Clp protease proteolytic subunit [Myxococcota bacterium]